MEIDLCFKLMMTGAVVAITSCVLGVGTCTSDKKSLPLMAGAGVIFGMALMVVCFMFEIWTA